MNKNRIFIDCGQYDGVAIKQYCVDNSWDIYSFDPEPQENLDLPPHKLIEKAVWTSEGMVEFSLDPRKQASHVKGIAGTDFEDVVKVPSVDFSSWVATFLPGVMMVCSMDIEGSEYPVLRKMIEMGTISRFTVLDIEFHHRMMGNEDAETTRKLIQEISKFGVIVRLKITLT